MAAGQKWVEASAGYSTLWGPYARGEVGYKLLPFMGLYSAIQWSPKETKADAGVRVTF